MAGAEALNVAVIGAAGYVGGELLRLLATHPGVSGLRAFSESASGNAWSAVHPAMLHLREGRFEAPDLRAAAAWADVVFLALPHGRSQREIETIEETAPRLVIDLAADFRVRDASLVERYYGPHVCPERLSDWSYGLADVAGSRLAGARRIAAPGCFATATLLALHAAVSCEELVGEPTCFAVTGSSGSGAEPRRTTHHPVRAHNVFAYSLAGHRHEAEITDQLRRWTGKPEAACTLLTHSAPLVRGIHATLHARLAAPAADASGRLAESYRARPFVRILDRPPELAAVVGTNFAHLHAATRAGGRELVVTAVIDNLVKGAAGQAVQAMNLALGLPETGGLEFGGIYPC